MFPGSLSAPNENLEVGVSNVKEGCGCNSMGSEVLKDVFCPSASLGGSLSVLLQLRPLDYPPGALRILTAQVRPPRGGKRAGGITYWVA